MGTVIFSIIGIAIVGFVFFFVRGMLKMERKESLLILRHKYSIAQRAIDLLGYNIINVKFFKDSDGTEDQSKELYEIIDNKRQNAA